MSNEKGDKNQIIPGKGSTFTPSRNANWIDEFNAMLVEEDISRNKLIEKLIVLGIEAKQSNRNLNEIKTMHSGGDSFMINSPLFSKEQIELLHTTHYRNIMESFVLQMFNSTARAEKETLDKFALNQEMIEPSMKKEKSHNDDVVPTVESKKIEVAAPTEKEDVNPPLKKANLGELSKMISSMKND